MRTVRRVRVPIGNHPYPRGPDIQEHGDRTRRGRGRPGDGNHRPGRDHSAGRADRPARRGGLAADQLTRLYRPPRARRHGGRAGANLGRAPMSLDQFGHDTWWLVLVKIVAVFAFLVVMTLFTINY